MSKKIFLANVGAKIRQVRSKKNMTQIELAVLCDFEKASMSRIESGRTNPTILTLKKISEALDIHISDLLKD